MVRISRWLGGIMFVLLSACSDEGAVAPTRRGLSRELRPAADLQGGSFSLPVPDNSDLPLQGGAPWQATGLKARRGVNVRTRMPSTMIASYQPPPPDTGSCLVWNVPEGEVSPQSNPSSTYPQLGRVRYTITPDSAGTVGPSPTLYGGWSRKADGSWVGVTYLGNASPDSGYLSFYREALDGVCNGHVKYDLAGSQAITVDFPEIRVTSNMWSIPVGTPAHFSVTATGFTPSASQWFWEWQGQSGSISVSTCLGQSQCDFAPPGSGYMLVGVWDAEGLLYKGQSVELIAPCAPVGDSLIDRPDWKPKVDTLLQKSILGPQPHQRQEWGFQVLLDTTTNAVSLGPIEFSGTACESPAVPTANPPHEVVALVHSHPHYKGEDLTVACGLANQAKFDPRANGGGSDKDWLAYRAYGRPVYAVSPEWIHRLDNPDSTQWKYNTKRYRREASGCWEHKP